MLPDIFSTFDPAIYTSIIPSASCLLILNLLFISCILISNFTYGSRKISLVVSPTEVIFSQLQRTRSKSLKGFSLIITATFIFIIFTNLIGILPYIFSLSSHLILTLSIGLPIWISLLISSFSYSPKASIAHFLPDGAPDWLNPFLVLIETSRIAVRPLTLSFRLAANMTAGHIVLSLLGIYCRRAILSSVISSSTLTLISIGYIAFELAICLIQAYIFCLLLSLYREDHAH